MAQGQTRRQALYFPAAMLADLQGEAMRQDRSISWLIQQAWRLSRSELQRTPSTTDFLPSAGPELAVSDLTASDLAAPERAADKA